MTRQVLLDTDIGSDIDDELALAMLWGSPEIQLLGVSTSYGDTVLRARIVARMAALTGRTVDVAAGETTTWSGRAVWWAGHEGAGYGDLSGIDVPAGGDPSAGARLLAERAAGTDLVAIAPLSTVAAALDALADGPGFASITLMGGDWADPGRAEHNIASDTDAARRVVTADVPITAVGLDVTQRVRLGEGHIRAIEATGPLGAVVAAAMRAWMRRFDEDFEVPHDPLAALTLVRPELFAFSPPGTATVDDEGRVVHRPGPGTVRVATDVDVPAAIAEILARVLAGLAAVPPFVGAAR